MASTAPQVNVDITGDVMESPPRTPPVQSEDDKSGLSGCKDKTMDVVAGVLLVIICVVGLPFFLVYLAGSWFFCGADGEEVKEGSDVGEKGRFTKIKAGILKTAMRVRMAKLPLLIRQRLVVLCLAWFVVNLSVSWLRKKDILGSHLWKWTFLLALILCGYHFISQLGRFLVFTLRMRKTFMKTSNTAEYYIKGLRRSMSLVLYSALLLLTWIFYFRTTHGIKKKGQTDDILHIGTWTMVTLTVVAILWMLKNVVLLVWEANAVYSRFRNRILKIGSMCYFLKYIYGWEVAIFQQPNEDNATEVLSDHEQPEYAVSVASSTTTGIPGEKPKSSQGKKEKEKEKEKAQNILLIKDDATTNLYGIKKMSKYFMRLSKYSTREDDGTSYVLSRCQLIQRTDRNYVMEEDFEEFGLEATAGAKDLLEMLKEGHKSNQKISYKQFEKSMVKAHKNCIELGHTLVDATGVVNVLDRVMTLILAIVAIVAWLLLTDLASTKILVFLVSPLVGATFVFGDTAKKIFEGIIFTFINHPFDIGDKCVIQEKELEVKRMNVLSTTFMVIGTKEEALYPNSSLASISIVNLKGDPDPNDQAELILDPSYTSPELKELEHKIVKFFKDDNGNRYAEDVSVVVNDVGETSIKMAIQYQHVFSIHETTHSQCLEKKKKQRSQLLLKLKQLTEEIHESKAPSNIS